MRNYYKPNMIGVNYAVGLFINYINSLDSTLINDINQDQYFKFDPFVYLSPYFFTQGLQYCNSETSLYMIDLLFEQGMEFPI